MAQQRIRKFFDSALEVAIRYYSIISILNNLHLTERQIQLLAFMSIKGPLSSASKKAEFVSTFNSSEATIGNIMSILNEKKLFVKEGKKNHIHPSLRLNFEEPIILQILLENKKEDL